MERVFVKSIRLNDDSPRNDGLKPVRIELNNDTYTFFTIDNLKDLLKFWIIGEEEKYSQSQKCRGRWLLFEEILKIFNTEDLNA